MTTVAVRPQAPARATTLRTLAGLEARRYVRHPLFLTGVALLVVVMAIISKDLKNGTADPALALTGDMSIAPAFFLGLLGVFVGHRLTRSLAGSADAVEASPADGVVRTAALCLACLVPGAVAVVWVVWMYVARAVWQTPDSPAIRSADRAAMLMVGVVCAVGGPLLGVMIGRWTRFAGAGLLAVVVLFAWVALSTIGLSMSVSRIETLIRLNSPLASWVAADDPTSAPWVGGGSPLWYLVYITLLCGVAATAAMIHEAVGGQRSRLVRVWVTLTVLALVSLALAVAPDPTRIPL